MAFVALAAAGCVTHHVRVDSLARPRAEIASYEVRIAPSSAAADSLRAEELARQVRAALGARGMYEAPANTKPDVIVELGYGIDPPQMKPRRIPSAIDRPEPLVPPMPRQVGIDENGKPVFVTPRVFSTLEGFFEMVPVYEKYLHITARENSPAVEGRPPNEIWRIDVSTESESRDLRKALPILVAASIDYIGEDSHGHKTVRVKETAAEVGRARQGL